MLVLGNKEVDLLLFQKGLRAIRSTFWVQAYFLSVMVCFIGKRTVQSHYIKGNNESYRILFHIERSPSLSRYNFIIIRTIGDRKVNVAEIKIQQYQPYFYGFLQN